MSLHLKGQITNGVFETDFNAIQEYAVTQKDGRYDLEIKRYRKKRGNAVNRYYHKILTILADKLHYYPSEVKEMVKTKLLHYEWIKDLEGNDKIRWKSTADYTQEDFNKAIELVQLWGAQNGIYIMDSNEFKEQNL